MYTTEFKVQQFCVLPTHCIYVPPVYIQQFCVLFTLCLCVSCGTEKKEAIISLYSINWLVFIINQYLTLFRVVSIFGSKLFRS
jgi:hypothetical protein